jgi:5-methylcytosine-specific restriction enzyme A
VAKTPAPGERIRGRRGQELRRQRLEREPACRLCAEKGITKAATVPDHIKPLAQGGTDTEDNIRCLCDDHHREVTAQQFNQVERPKIREDGRPEGWGDDGGA